MQSATSSIKVFLFTLAMKTKQHNHVHVNTGTISTGGMMGLLIPPAQGQGRHRYVDDAYASMPMDAAVA
jgi:hypothetical protein